MNTPDPSSTYLSLAGEGSGEYTEKKSRFLARAVPCTTEAQALEVINIARRQYADARHHVYAYLLRDNHLMRYTDDGEPQGTAGVPILDVLRKRQLTDLCVVVTRYFGGVLLGTGGLVHAYTTAACQAIENGGIVTYALFQIFYIQCSYSDYQKILHENQRFSVRVEHADFSQHVALHCTCPATLFDSYQKKLIELTAGNVEFVLGETHYDCDK